MVPKYGHLDWSRPIQRHYLVRSFVGDQKEAQETIDGDVTGGAYANVVCELSFAQGMVPHQIVKCKDSPLYAVLFRSSITRDISWTLKTIFKFMIRQLEEKDETLFSCPAATLLKNEQSFWLATGQ